VDADRLAAINTVATLNYKVVVPSPPSCTACCRSLAQRQLTPSYWLNHKTRSSSDHGVQLYWNCYTVHCIRRPPSVVDSVMHSNLKVEEKDITLV